MVTATQTEAATEPCVSMNGHTKNPLTVNGHANNEADEAGAQGPGDTDVKDPTAEPGTRRNLTPSETSQLQEAWIHILRLCGSEAAAVKDTSRVTDKTAQHRQGLMNNDPEHFRELLWNGFLADHPDVLILRFLRARKWDQEKSLAMALEALNWRDERRIDETIVKEGENVALKGDKMSTDDKGFIMQYKSGKSFVRGTDKEGRPIYVIRVKLHNPKAQSGEAMEAFTLHGVESIRLLCQEPYDKCCLLFDMTGFGLKNMDFHVVKFLVQVFEARYPETLGLVLIHNAPFVFWGVWNIIKGWLDPVIAAKINFTRSASDILKFIPKDQVHTRYGGTDKWEYEYVEPKPGDQDHLDLNEENKQKVLNERQMLQRAFEALTEQWIAMDAQCEQAIEKTAQRTEVAQKLRNNYMRLDPYVRARTYYHRVGVVDDEGHVDFQGAK